MTAAQYLEAYINARKRTPTLVRSVMKDLKAVYIDASDKVVADFLSASGLASERLASIDDQLNAAQAAIAEATQTATLDAVDKLTKMYGAIDEKLLKKLISGTILTPEGIRSVIVGVNQRVILETLTRLGQDGYTLSSRVWQVGRDYRTQIARLIGSGQAQGRSIKEIAQDIGDYTKGGYIKLPNGYTQAKYGKLVVKNVDWRAFQLVRSEVGASQKIAAVALGEANPASEGLYDWVRIDTQQHDCICPELAAGSPYKAEDVPAQPHPNCFCQVRPRLKDLKTVTSDFKRWAAGEEVPYLDVWYRTQYTA